MSVGNGYVEGVNARLIARAPINSILEGSGKRTRLDVLRARKREPQRSRYLDA